MNPEIQLIANCVVTRPNGDLLFVRYDKTDERWWLPGADLRPFEQPEEAARRALAELRGLRAKGMELRFVESFRGRRGWHVVFHYRVRAAGRLGKGKTPAAWFPRAKTPPTVHRPWEANSIARALARGR